MTTRNHSGLQVEFISAMLYTHMSRTKSMTIYSPEQIARRMREIESTGLIPQNPPVIVQQVIDERRMNDLEKKLAEVKRTITTRGRKSPTELRAALGDLFEAYDFSPAEELVRMVMEKREDGKFTMGDSLRVKVLSELQSYVMPKLSATKVEGRVDHQHTVMIVRYGEDGAIQTEKIRDITPKNSLDEDKIKEAVIVEKVVTESNKDKSG